MIPYLEPEFVRALLGLDACDGAAEAPLDLDGAKPPVTPAKMKAESPDCRYTAQRITQNRDKNILIARIKRREWLADREENDAIGVGRP
jgi:hypothetical protein